MKKAIEINVYSLESAINADLVGADRIELCSSMFEGGCTPSTGLIKAIQEKCDIAIHAMLRPRGGDFTYSAPEKFTMLKELEALLKCGISGIVTGALTPAGKLDKTFLKELLRLNNQVEWTFHRAIDMTIDTEKIILELQDLGFNRILTSGKYGKAEEGLRNLKKWVEIPGRKIEIMAGSGISPTNIREFLSIGVDAVHLSGKKMRESEMVYRNHRISMGGIEGIPEYGVYYSDLETLQKSVQLVRDFGKS